MKTIIENGTTKFIGDFKGTGKYWFFDNGQYGEKMENTARKEYRLAYHYDRVYVSSYTRHNMEGGPITDSTQAPLSCYINTPEVMDIARVIFESDKKLGIISQDYKFI